MIGIFPLSALVHSDVYYLHFLKRLKDPNERCKRGYTLLHLAAQSVVDNHKIVRYLIVQGADVNSTTQDGQTPLHLAVSKRNQFAVDAIIEAGASVISKDLLGRTPLHLSVSNLIWGDEDASIDRDLWIVERLLCHPEIVIDEIGETMLMWEVQKRNSNAVRRLLKKGVDPNIPNGDQQSRLHEALSAKFPHRDIVGLLLTHGADIYSKDISQQTAVDILLRNVDRDDEGTLLIAKHVLWLIAPRYPIRDCLWKKLEQIPYLRNYLKHCCKEVSLMRKTILYGNVTLHDFALNCFQTKFCAPLRDIYLPVVEILASESFRIYRDLIFCHLSDPDLYGALKEIVKKWLDIKWVPFDVSSESASIICRAYSDNFLLKMRLRTLEHSL